MCMLRPSIFGCCSTTARSENGQPLLGVGHLATAEHDGDLDLVALTEETKHVTLLGLVVARIDLGAELHLLDLDLGLVLARLLGLDRLLVLVLAVIHDAANGRIGVGSDLYQIETLVFGKALCRVVSHLVLGAIDTNDEELRRMNLTVDPCVLSCYDKHLLIKNLPSCIQPTGTHKDPRRANCK